MIGATLSLEDARTLPWPDPASCSLVTRNRRQLYSTPDGEFHRVTTVLKVLGLGTEGLIKWSAEMEREACLAALSSIVSDGLLDRLHWPEHDSKDWSGVVLELQSLVKARLGPERAHQRLLRDAGDIGSAVHEAIRREVRLELGQPVGPEVSMPDPALLAFMAWQDWWKASGYVSVRSEQPVWIPQLKVAGTADHLAWCPKRGLGLIDYKTGKSIYDHYHLQVSAYRDGAFCVAGEPIQWAEIVRLPKVYSDPEFEVRAHGELYNRTLTQDEMSRLFADASRLYFGLVA